MASPSANFPIGWGYVCKQSWNATNPQYSNIKRGTEGKILAFDSSNNMALVTMPRLRKQGWVHKNALRVGTPADRKYGSVKILSDVPTADLSNLQIQISSDRLDGTLEGLLFAFKRLQSAPELDGILPTAVTDLLNDNARYYGALTSIKIGTTTEYRQLASRNDFTCWDLMNSLPEVPFGTVQGNLGGGIYHVIVWKFKNQPSRTPEVYTGQTFSFLQRFNQECNPKKEDYNDLSKAVRAAAKVDGRLCVRMKIACRFPSGTDSQVVNTAEQLFLLCGQTYSPVELSLLQADGTVTTREEATTVMKYFDSNNRAARLTNVANSVFKKTSWPGMCGRESFGAPVGLNHLSPFCGRLIQHKSVWVETSVPGVMKHYRRGPKSSGSTQTAVFLSLDSKDAAGKYTDFVASLPRGAVPPNIDIWTVVEIMDDAPHPLPWFRRERLDIWDDSYYSDRIAMAVEFENPKGTWFKRYLQGFYPMVLANNTFIGSHVQYAQIMAIGRYLKHEVMQNPYSWTLNFGFASLKKATWDCPTQNLEIRTVYPQDPPIQVKRPELLTNGQIGKMRDAGARNINGPFRVFTQPGTTGVRIACDSCYAHKFVHGHDNTGTCTKVDGKDQCTLCQVLNRPCSWTRPVPDALSRLLGPQPAATYQQVLFRLTDHTVIELPRMQDGSLV